MAEYVIAAALLGGTILSAKSQYEQGKEEKRLYAQRAAVAEEEAVAVTKATEHEERLARKEGRRYVKMQKMLFAKAGVKPKTGTPLLVMEETEQEYLRDAAFIRESGATEARRLRSEAGLERQMGKIAYRAGKWGAWATTMTGLGTTGMFAYERGWLNKYAKKRV